MSRDDGTLSSLFTGNERVQEPQNVGRRGRRGGQWGDISVFKPIVQRISPAPLDLQSVQPEEECFLKFIKKF